MTGKGEMTNQLLQALLMASEEQKRAALKALRSDTEAGTQCKARQEPYLTLRELAGQLGISKCSLWRWRVPGHALGGRRRFRLSEVTAYLESEEFRKRATELKESRRGASA
jgi:hypothetical protein